MILLPYSTEVVIKKWPISNLIIIGLCSISFIILVTGGFAEGMLNAMVLYGWNPIGLVGHQFPHAGLWHPVFNMLCLWIFGNAVCEKTGNGIFAGIVHNIFNSEPAAGANGSINGIIGFHLVLYPVNEVNCCRWFLFRRRKQPCSCPHTQD